MTLILDFQEIILVYFFMFYLYFDVYKILSVLFFYCIIIPT